MNMEVIQLNVSGRAVRDNKYFLSYQTDSFNKLLLFKTSIEG